MSSWALIAPCAASEERGERPSSSLVVFGATGDLARRKLFPALYNLAHDGLLPPGFKLIGTSRSRLGTEDFRGRVSEAVHLFSRRAPDQAVLADLLSRFQFLPGYSDDEALHCELARRLDALDAGADCPADRLFFLSTAPELFSPIVEGLGRQGLQRRPEAAVRLLIEKPFGRSADEASAFNATVLSAFEEAQVFRIDHYLGKEEVQNILALRFANAIFEPFWNRAVIASVQVTAAEDLGVGARAGYYDGAGALRDHVQNHMLQLLCMICMEPPGDRSASALRDEKVKVLAAVAPPGPGEVLRAQYGEGVMADGQAVPGYLQEVGVARDSQTETYVALRLAVDTPRWAGVPFYLRTGKRLARKETEIAISLRPAAHPTFLTPAESFPVANQLLIGLRPAGAVQITLATKVPGVGMRTRPVTVELPSTTDQDLVGDAYERLLLDALAGDPTLFTRSDEIEQQWRICDPVLRRWAEENSPLSRYSAGSQGSADAGTILAPGDAWRAI